MTAHGKENPGDRSGTATSTGFLERIRAADDDAWRLLVKLYSPLVYTWCRKSGLAPEDARDVHQEVFLAVHRGLTGFRRDRPGAFRKWLTTITQRKIADAFREGAHRPRACGGTGAQQQWLNVPAPGKSAAVSSVTNSRSGGSLSRILAPVRAEFEDGTWQAFWRSVIHGEPTSQIGAELGMSDNAVRKAKYRVLRRLRRDFEGLIG